MNLLSLLPLLFTLGLSCTQHVKPLLEEEISGNQEGADAGDCTDGLDNDSDGKTDCEDSGCAEAAVCDGDTG